ncbi:MAG: hypothetical protein ACYDBJ_05275 [Aggregatilineales bacterium]
MFKPFSPRTQEVETPLEATARQYARAGWHVTSRVTNSIILEKGERDPQTVRLTANADGQVQIDGPELAAFSMDGRMRAWLLLLAMLIAAFAVAWALGFFR